MISDYPDLARRHREAAVEYATLRRRADQVLASTNVEPEHLQEVDNTWKLIEANAPPLTTKIRERGHRLRTEAAQRRESKLGTPRQTTPR